LLENRYSAKANPKDPAPRETHIKAEAKSNIPYFTVRGFLHKMGITFLKFLHPNYNISSKHGVFSV
jgi:hypothetical protein